MDAAKRAIVDNCTMGDGALSLFRSFCGPRDARERQPWIHPGSALRRRSQPEIGRGAICRSVRSPSADSHDGFNTVVLVVPWRGFQRTCLDVDAFNIQKLQRIPDAVHAAGLASILRVSYPWNNGPDELD
jgi:hypothetical protein